MKRKRARERRERREEREEEPKRGQGKKIRRDREGAAIEKEPKSERTARRVMQLIWIYNVFVRDC